MTDAPCASLLDSIAVDERWIYHKGAGLKGMAGWGLNAWLKRRLLPFRPDWTLDFTGSDRSAYLAALSRAKRRVTFARFRKKPLRKLIFTDFVRSSVIERHTADHYTDLLRPLGIERDNVPLDLHLAGETFVSARALLASARVPCPYAVIHAGTARPEKYWSPKRWAAVIDFLHAERGLVSVLTGWHDPPRNSTSRRSNRTCNAHAWIFLEKRIWPPWQLSSKTQACSVASTLRRCTWRTR